MLDKTDYRDALVKLYPDPTEREARLASLEEIVNAAASYDKNRRATSPPSLSGFLDDMLLNERDDSDEKESQLARNAVALMTLHSAKGLEFPRVYLVGHGRRHPAAQAVAAMPKTTRRSTKSGGCATSASRGPASN